MTAQTFAETAPTVSELPTHHVQLSADFNAPYRKMLRNDVLDALQRGHRRVEVDCGRWRQLYLTILSALIQCAKACEQQTASFELLNLRREIRTAIEALRLDDRLGLRS